MRLPWSLQIRAICLVALTALVLAPSAGATNYLTDGLGRLSHQHSGYQRAFNEINENGSLYNMTDLARGEWDTKTNAAVVPWSTHSGSQQHYVDGYFGATGWQGIAEVVYHPATETHTTYNLSYPQGTYYMRAVACQEIGHLLGLNHFAGDCMGAGYFSSYTNGVTTHSINMVNTIVGNAANHP